MIWQSYRKQTEVRNAVCRSHGMESECFTTKGKDLASAYVLCPHLGTGCLYLRGTRKEGDEELNREVIFRGFMLITN